MSFWLKRLFLVLWSVVLILSQVAVSFTSKEVHFYDTLAQPHLRCHYQLQVMHPPFS